jgi:hypothetical protein
MTTSDWRIPLATDLARRCHEAGVRKADRGAIKKAIYTLAEQELAFIQNHPNRRTEVIGYKRAADTYGANGMGMLISMAIKYWPVEEKKEKTWSEVLQDGSATEVVNRRRDLKEAAESIPTPPKKVQAPLLERLDVVFQLTMDQPYAPEEVQKIIEPFLTARFPGKVHVNAVTGSGNQIRMSLGVATWLSEVAETLLGVSWVQDLVSLPA